jgi:tetratricopeptide (TPR) repeat protein
VLRYLKKLFSLPPAPVAFALVKKGKSLAEKGSCDEAVATFDEVVRRFGRESDVTLRELVAIAQLNKGSAFEKTDRLYEAVAVFDEVVNQILKFGWSSLALNEFWAKALFHKACALDQIEAPLYEARILNRNDDDQTVSEKMLLGNYDNKTLLLGRGFYQNSTATLDEIIELCGAKGDLALRKWVAQALDKKARVYFGRGRYDDAIATLDDIVRRFETANEFELRNWVAQALTTKGYWLGFRLNRYQEAVACCDDVVWRFGSASELPLRERVVQSMIEKGCSLHSWGRPEEAIMVLQDIVDRFGNAGEPSIRKLVEDALAQQARIKLAQPHIRLGLGAPPE